MIGEQSGSMDETKVVSDSVLVPSTEISVYQALYRRRMAWRYQDVPVERDVITRMLDTAAWAPNHKLTEPWRFFVTEKGTSTRQQVADLAYEYQMGRFNSANRAEATRLAVLDPPIVIYAYSVPAASEELTKENYASVVCAAQNISLAGFAEGLAVTWETGGATRHPKLKEVLGAEEEWSLATMLSIGFPGEFIVSKRSPIGQFVKWLS
jgi:nitroreductase